MSGLDGAFNRLRDHVPVLDKDRKLSKFEILEMAMTYIQDLRAELGLPIGSAKCQKINPVPTVDTCGLENNAGLSGDILNDLVSLQGSKGDFSWGLALSHLLNGREKNEILDEKPEIMSDAIWISAIAVKLLEKLLNNKSRQAKQTWEFVLQKARDFIKSGLKDDESLLLEEAVNVIP